MIYLVFFKPFTENVENLLEIMNEFSILVISWHLPIFTHFVYNPDIQYSFGWSIIAVTITNILINTLYVMIIHLMALYSFIKNKNF